MTDATTDDAATLGTDGLRLALRRRFPAPAWAMLEEVGDSTGWDSHGFCDAIAVSCWKSAGRLEVLGFEIKASRGDWLRELKEPSKSGIFRRYCDRWYLVAGDRSIVKEGELPEGWGLMVPHGSGSTRTLRAIVEAPLMTPEPPARGFLAALARRMVEASYDRKRYEQAYDAGYKAGVERGLGSNDSLKVARRDLKRLGEEAEAIVERVRYVLGEVTGKGFTIHRDGLD